MKLSLPLKLHVKDAIFFFFVVLSIKLFATVFIFELCMNFPYIASIPQEKILIP